MDKSSSIFIGICTLILVGIGGLAIGEHIGSQKGKHWAINQYNQNFEVVEKTSRSNGSFSYILSLNNQKFKLETHDNLELGDIIIFKNIK